MFFPLFMLRSASVSVLMIVLSGSLRERIGKLEIYPNLKDEVVGAHLAGASVTTATLSNVSRVTVSEVMSVCTNHGKTESAKGKSGQKSTFLLKERIVLKSVSTIASTGDSRTEYS
jgi:hypothetical protein